MRLKICGSHLSCKVTNKCPNVREQVEGVNRNRNNDGPLPSPAVPCLASIRERKLVSLSKNLKISGSQSSMKKMDTAFLR